LSSRQGVNSLGEAFGRTIPAVATYGDSSNLGIAQRLLALWRVVYPELNQAAFAEAVGTTSQAMNNYLKGGRRIDLNQAITIAQRTQLTLDWIYLGNAAGLPMHLAPVTVLEPEPEAPTKTRRRKARTSPVR
jgi:transcriptional regulator with XRE-family HTH domain